MWSASNTFKEKAVDGFSPQNVVMVFNDLFFSANDGDFAESGITWNGYFNTAEDLTYGEAPSDTESFSLINDNGVLASFEYGVEQTYFGVQTDSESFSLPSGDNCYIEYDGDGKWNPIGTLVGKGGHRYSNYPLVPERCDHFRLKFRGKGNSAIWNIDVLYNIGGKTK